MGQTYREASGRARFSQMRLAGVLVYCSQDRFEAMRRFYLDLLDQEPRSDRPGFVNFQWADVRLTVAVHSSVSAVNPDPARIMVNLETNQIHEHVGRLASDGVVVHRLPELEPWGGWVATLEDPCGNYVQLIQPASE